LAANAGQDEQSCICTPTTLGGNEIHQVEIGRVQDSQQIWFGWAWEDWCWGEPYQWNFLSWPAEHYTLYGYTCTYMNVVGMYIYVHVCNSYEHVYTHYSFVCTWITQNITDILDCVC
jgi:hypothetical protein